MTIDYWDEPVIGLMERSVFAIAFYLVVLTLAWWVPILSFSHAYLFPISFMWSYAFAIWFTFLLEIKKLCRHTSTYPKKKIKKLCETLIRRLLRCWLGQVLYMLGSTMSVSWLKVRPMAIVSCQSMAFCSRKWAVRLGLGFQD